MDGSAEILELARSGRIDTPEFDAAVAAFRASGVDLDGPEAIELERRAREANVLALLDRAYLEDGVEGARSFLRMLRINPPDGMADADRMADLAAARLAGMVGENAGSAS